MVAKNVVISEMIDALQALQAEGYKMVDMDIVQDIQNNVATNNNKVVIYPIQIASVVLIDPDIPVEGDDIFEEFYQMDS